MITIRCTFPPSSLSPNARLHWAPKARATASSKLLWYKELLIYNKAYNKALEGKTEFKISFAPPDKCRRDVDNLIASCKALCDSLALVTHIDDSKFKIEWARELLVPVAGGAVFISFENEEITNV